MNSPENQPSEIEGQVVDIEEQRRWLRDHKIATNMSGGELAKRVGRAWGTLSQFLGEKGYNGREQPIADQVWAYRQMLQTQQLYTQELPTAPKFYPTPTSDNILSTVIYTHTYRKQSAIGTGAGMGKTKLFRHYKEIYPQVFLATMKPSTKGVNNMQLAVLKALGVKDPKGAPYRLTEMIMEKLMNSGALLIIDETQHLETEAIEEIRSWHDLSKDDDDKPGFGLVFGGNLPMMQRLEGANRGAEFAQIFSRIGFKLVLVNGVQGDADAMCAAWGIDDEKIIAAMRKIVVMPGALRQATEVLTLAQLMASGAGVPLDAGHVGESYAQLSLRSVAA